jgi:hypothetical protein
MICWLASYPKSGNTLLRSILGSYFYSKDGNFHFNNLYKISQFPLLSQFTKLNIDTNNDVQVFKNFINAQKLINFENKQLKFLKTHSSLCKMYECNFTDLANSFAVIYIVRDPRNVVSSFSHHYGLSIDEATKTMMNKKNFQIRNMGTATSFLGSWDFNYNSWKKFGEKNRYLLIKYEDLVSRKKTTLIKIFKFLKKLSAIKNEIDMVKLNRVIKSTEFEQMKKLEKKEIFQESIVDVKTGERKNFFNLGPKNNWQEILDAKTQKLIEKEFKKDMEELGYL